MFRMTGDFTSQWKRESDNTLRLLGALTDESLGTSIVAGGRDLGFLGWHLVIAMGAMLSQAGFSPDVPARGTPAPKRAADIADAYRRGAESVLSEAGALDDEKLTEMITFFGMTMPRGMLLEILIRHEAHHRGQMTVLMRQAGLRVPGMYGPSLEERAEMGLEAQP